MPLCQKRHRLNTIQEILSSKKCIPSDEYDAKLRVKNPKKINCQEAAYFLDMLSLFKAEEALSL